MLILDNSLREQHESMKGTRGKVFIGRVYAARAYASWVGWIFTISTFLIVSYDDILEIFPWLVTIFPNVFVFVIIGLPIILSMLVIIGKWDFKGGSYKPEAIIGWQENPEWMDFLEDFESFKTDMKDKLTESYKKIEDILVWVEHERS